MSTCNFAERLTTRFNLGTFEGFNFRNQSAIEHELFAEDVINWDQDEAGEAEFWPSGDRPEVQFLFKDRNAVTGSELTALDRLLTELGDDSTENFLRIHHLVNTCGGNLAGLSASAVEDQAMYLFSSDESIYDLRKDAAYELFELFYPEEYAMWEKSHCDGLIFETDVFLDSPCWSVEEVELGDRKHLIIVGQ